MRRKFLAYGFVFFLFIGTNLTSFFGGLKSHKAPDIKPMGFYQKDGDIYCGVAVPNDVLSGKFFDDMEVAKTFLVSHGKWTYVLSGPVPGFESYTGFVFKAPIFGEPLATN